MISKANTQSSKSRSILTKEVSDWSRNRIRAGAHQFSQNVMQGIRMGLQQKRNEQLDDLYKQAIDYTRTTWHSPYSAPISVTLQPELVGDRR